MKQEQAIRPVLDGGMQAPQPATEHAPTTQLEARLCNQAIYLVPSLQMARASTLASKPALQAS